MSKNKTLSAAKSAKNDEFYTQYADIQKEINAYLDYDPDVFRGKTVLLPCDEAYVIVTNPPFSLFRGFLAWILATKNAKDAKQFLIIGNMNAIKYKETFPLIKTNKMWLGATGNGTDMVFGVPETAVISQHDRDKAAKMGYVGSYTRLGNSCWFTNIEHGRRHQPLQLMTERENIKYSRHKEVRGIGYRRYINFAVSDAHGVPQYFSALAADLQKRILGAKLTVYVCEGGESEIKEWFKTINIAGIPLNEQELLNAIHSGPFVTKAKETFSNSANVQMQKWKAYVKGNEKRQEVLRTALEWVSKGHVEEYMSAHRHDVDIAELKTYFETVIDWADGVFPGMYDEMCGLDWGRLYETYHANAYDPAKVWARVKELYADEFVRNRKGIFEYVLGGEKDTRLLDVRVFEPKETKAVYAKQTATAEKKGISNCPLCAIGHDANAKRIWKFNEMDADHVTPWSKGGATNIKNCQMLCRTHNRAKGNR